MPGGGDARVAGVLGSTMLGMSILGAVISGASMGAGLAGALFSWLVSRLAGLPRRYWAAGASWLAAAALLHVAALGLGVASSPLAAHPPSRVAAGAASAAAAALLAASVALRGRVLGVPGARLLAALSASAALAPLQPMLLVVSAFAAAGYALLEARAWSLAA